MKGKKYLIFIVIIVAIFALLLARGFWKKDTEQVQKDSSAVVQLGESISNSLEAESGTEQDVLVQIDESLQETSEEEATSEAEEASTEEVEIETETLTVNTSKPSKAPEKSSTSASVTKPATTPTPEVSQQPSTTPNPEPSQQPTTTPQPEPSQQPTITPQPQPSQQPTTTPQPEPSQQPTTTPSEPESSQQSTTTPSEPESSQQPTTTPSEPESSQQPTTTPSEPESSQQPTTTPSEPESSQQPSTTPSEPESTPDASEPSEEPELVLVQQGEYDLRVIPDKFNTGCKNEENMLKINSAVTIGGVEYTMGDNNDTVVIDLFYRNKDIVDDVVIKNIDFSGKKFAIRHTPQTAKKITFENCKFDEVATTIGKDIVSVVFTDCSFRRFYGSNSTFYNCTFGGSVTDGMNPYSDVHVYNSYFSDFDYDNPTGVHTDAIHIYGKEGIDAENISFHNCRIEIPSIHNGKNNKINACFMVALEYSNAKNLLFENCFINGGGYSIYALANPGFFVENVKFSNIVVGGGKLYGNVYPKLDEKVVLNDVKSTNSIYVASVWKDEVGKVHLSATNDTAQDRYLVVETADGCQEFMLPCKKTVEQIYESDNGRAPYFSELSVDVEIILEATNPDWIICYDKYDTTEKQIRFVNWSGEDVYH